MQTFTDENGNSFELPKLTLALQEKNNAAKGNTDFKALVKARYDFLKSVLPSEYLNERLNGKAEASIDIIELSKLYMLVDNAYWGEERQTQVEVATAQMEQVKDLVNAANSMAKITNRQGFNRVV